MRVDRPTDQLLEVTAFYRDGFGMTVLTSFEDHDGFDGVILGHMRAPYHLEFTHHRDNVGGHLPRIIYWHYT